MTTMTLNDAIIIATNAHAGQLDKAGHPYILHPMRVAGSLYSRSEAVLMTAVLHDVLEDTSVTSDDLWNAGIPVEAFRALTVLTHADNEPYMDYIARVRTNAIARMVKLADIQDNTDPARLEALPPQVRSRLTAKYASALEALK